MAGHKRQIRPTRQPERVQTQLGWHRSAPRADGVFNPQEQSFREEILSGLLVDKGGAAQISTAMREPTISGLEISTEV